MDKHSINNQIVSMRIIVKKSKCHTINKLVRTIRDLKKRKGPDILQKKYAAKANRLAALLPIIKKIAIDDVSKFALTNEHFFGTEIAGKETHLRALKRLTQDRSLQLAVKEFSEKNKDYLNRLSHLFSLWDMQKRQLDKHKKGNKLLPKDISDAANIKPESCEQLDPETSLKRNNVAKDPQKSVGKMKKKKKISAQEIIKCDVKSDEKNSESSTDELMTKNLSTIDESDLTTNDLRNDSNISSVNYSSSNEDSFNLSSVNSVKKHSKKQNVDVIKSDVEIRQINLDEINDEEVPILKTKSPDLIKSTNSKTKNLKKSAFFIYSDENNDSSSSEDDEKEKLENLKMRRREEFDDSTNNAQGKRNNFNGRRGTRFSNLGTRSHRGRGYGNINTGRRGGKVMDRGRGRGFSDRGKNSNKFRHNSQKFDSDNANLTQPDSVPFKKFGLNKSSPRANFETLKDNEALHPSWAAKKRQKEMQTGIPTFEGKKIKFD